MKVINQNAIFYTKYYIFCNTIFNYRSIIDNHMTAAKYENISSV